MIKLSSSRTQRPARAAHAAQRPTAVEGVDTRRRLTLALSAALVLLQGFRLTHDPEFHASGHHNALTMASYIDERPEKQARNFHRRPQRAREAESLRRRTSPSLRRRSCASCAAKQPSNSEVSIIAAWCTHIEQVEDRTVSESRPRKTGRFKHVPPRTYRQESTSFRKKMWL